MANSRINSKKKSQAHRQKRFHRAPPGTAPGALNIPEDALRVHIRAFAYNQEQFDQTELSSLQDIKLRMEKFPDRVHWFDIKGFGNKMFLEQLADYFSIHRLQMEDVVNTYQRPKVEEFQGHLFFISRMLAENNCQLSDDQLSILLFKNVVITIQDKYEDILEPVRIRITQGKGYMRSMGADYLAYSLMDVVVDNYYPVMEQIGERLDELQDELLLRPTREVLNKVLLTKRELISLRRIIWSERDKMNDILRSNFSLITSPSLVFFRDTYDHCTQLLDLVENYKEVCASLMDVYHSSLSNKMNQVMKVLTIISTIFIPLTFIVGLYGMNFSRVDPETGKFFPLNMPELYSPYGYISVCFVMVIIVIFQIAFFYKKGWLDKN